MSALLDEYQERLQAERDNDAPPSKDELVRLINGLSIRRTIANKLDSVHNPSPKYRIIIKDLLTNINCLRSDDELNYNLIEKLISVIIKARIEFTNTLISKYSSIKLDEDNAPQQKDLVSLMQELGIRGGIISNFSVMYNSSAQLRYEIYEILMIMVQSGYKPSAQWVDDLSRMISNERVEYNKKLISELKQERKTRRPAILPKENKIKSKSKQPKYWGKNKIFKKDSKKIQKIFKKYEHGNLIYEIGIDNPFYVDSDSRLNRIRALAKHAIDSNGRHADFEFQDFLSSIDSEESD